MKILIVLTSHDTLGATGRKTGFWLEEFAAPYYAFLDAGAELTLASPRAASRRWIPRATTPRPRPRPPIVSVAMPRPAPARGHAAAGRGAGDHDAVFYGRPRAAVGSGRGSAFGEADPDMLAAGKPGGGVPCAGRAAPRQDRRRKPMVQGRQVTGFSNAEEAAVGLSQIVPFLVEDELVRLGAQYSRAEDWQPHVIADGLLITGQNPASSVGVAEALLERLRQ